MENHLSITENFSKALNKGLKQKFGKIPSSTEFANQFNLRAYGTRTVTRETARKWKCGLALPEAGSLQVLIEWLSLSTADIFSSSPSDILYSAADLVSASYKLQKSEHLAQAALNELSPRIAILDNAGVIILVNNAWRSHATSDPGLNTQKSCCEGVNYLKVCDNAHGSDSEYALQMVAGIRAVMRCERIEYALKYPCDSLGTKHWFIGRAISFASHGDICTVVSHEAITERRFFEDRL